MMEKSKKSTNKPTKHKKLSTQYKVCIGFAVVNLIYLAFHLGFTRSWGPSWTRMWWPTLNLIVTILMCLYALVQPKVNKRCLDIAAVVVIVILFLLNLLNMLVDVCWWPPYNFLLDIISAFVMIDSLIMLYARLTRKTVSRRISLFFIIGTLVLSLVGYFWLYSMWWPAEPYRGFPSDTYRVVAITLAGISGLFWVAREVGWVVVMRLSEKEQEPAEAKPKH